MPYTAVNPPTFLIPVPTLPTQQQQQQLEQSLHRQNQWPGKRVTLTKRSPTHDVVTIAGSPSKLGMEYTNVYPQQIPNSAQRNARPSSSPQGSPKLDLINAIFSNSLKSASPPTRRASYSSSPNKPSPLQISSQEAAFALPRTMSSGNLTSIPMLRKKSGEVVKPSLKRSAKSAPTTPTCPKYVHFDTQLEHVRLFLQAETPDAVKEDAEPGAEEEEQRMSDLTFVLPNWPVPSTMSNARMVFVESIAFSDDKSSLNGRIQVQNIAFHKNVTVRYTFDYWQSVHESHALYKESLSKDNRSSFDRFTFQISLVGKIGDNVAPEDEQRTMYFAVRYNVEGREIWDNNGGMNYQVEFKRTNTLSKPKISSWSMESSDLKDKDQKKSDILSSSPLSSSPSNETLPLKKKSQGNRYDFGASLSAAKKVAPVATAPVSAPVQPSSHRTSSTPARVQQNWPGYYPGVTTASSIVDGYPTTYGFSDEYLSASLSTEPSMSHWDSMRPPLDFSYGASPTTPISIPKASTRPAAGSTGYFDLVNKYCFYGGNSSPYSSSPYSNSPPAAVIRG
ncbi:putative phosphatase regulatory subunit-domain-containing protein [Endogone sp. FLAS-F59071]|nr:putative phosphatase regulatory subunit-domain-containing protein [Endogone sp. FLAS-F59071]|eukprot:RUS12965.1 putative phosphatase regulatory subunit-domain-containing protein [Endogone sp. FLAS-F59071]